MLKLMANGRLFRIHLYIIIYTDWHETFMHVDVAFQFGLLVFVELLFAKGTSDALRLEGLVVLLPEMRPQNHFTLIRFSADLG